MTKRDGADTDDLCFAYPSDGKKSRRTGWKLDTNVALRAIFQVKVHVCAASKPLNPNVVDLRIQASERPNVCSLFMPILFDLGEV